jgi:hypothetical protein
MQPVVMSEASGKSGFDVDCEFTGCNLFKRFSKQGVDAFG